MVGRLRCAHIVQLLMSQADQFGQWKSQRHSLHRRANEPTASVLPPARLGSSKFVTALRVYRRWGLPVVGWQDLGLDADMLGEQVEQISPVDEVDRLVPGEVEGRSNRARLTRGQVLTNAQVRRPDHGEPPRSHCGRRWSHTQESAFLRVRWPVLPGQAILQSGVAELVDGADCAQDIAVAGIF